MAVSDGPVQTSDDHARGQSPGFLPGEGDARAGLQEAWRLLRALGMATSALGDALSHAGLGSNQRREPDTELEEIAGQLGDPTVDGLMSRLTTFSIETGPAWLTGDGAALDDIEREARTLADVIRPLAALSRRERLRPPEHAAVADPGASMLRRALSYPRAGEHLDRLSHVLGALVDLAPSLSPLPPGQTLDVESEPYPIAFTPDGIPIEDAGDPDAPTWLMSGQLPDAPPDAPTIPIRPAREARVRFAGAWRPHLWTFALTALALILAVTGIYLVASGAISIDFGGGSSAQATSARATAVAGRLARAPTAMRTPTHARPTRSPSTPTPNSALPPGRLAAFPSQLKLTCPGSAPFTLTNTGGQPVSWVASTTGGIKLSDYSGDLDPGGSTTIVATATRVQRSASINFSWNGGYFAYRVVCR